MRFPLLVAVLVPTVAASLALGAPPPKKGAPGAGEPAPPPSTKTPSVCGVKILPLSVGNTWTYSMVPSPLPPDPQIARISPAEPDTIVVTVKAIDAKKGGDTTVTLEEKTTVDLTKDKSDPKKKQVLDEHTYTSTITCNAKKFEFSPESFFFAGEPGGYIGLKIDSEDHPKGTNWQLTNGIIGDAPWREDLAIKWTRVPTEHSDAKLGSGKIELERVFTPEQGEAVTTKIGIYGKTEKLALLTTGRVTLDGAAPDAKPMELPANWVTTFWVAEGTGIIQTLNSYSHMYQLTAATLK